MMKTTKTIVAYILRLFGLQLVLCLLYIQTSSGQDLTMDIHVQNNANTGITILKWYPSINDNVAHYEIVCYDTNKTQILSVTAKADEREYIFNGLAETDIDSLSVKSFNSNNEILEFSAIETVQKINTVTESQISEDPNGLKLSLVQTDSSQFPFVFLTVRATIDGAPTDLLRQENFLVVEDNALQQDFLEVTPPLVGGGVRLADVVFLIDTSGSMGEEIAAVRDNARAFADALAGSGIDYRLGLVQFGQSSNGGNPRVVGSGLVSDKEEFKNLVGSLSASGGNEPGFAAVRLAINNLNFRPGSQKVFILITDEDSDDRNKTDTINLINSNQVTVHVAVSCSFGTSNLDYCGVGSIRDESGGSQFSVTGPYNAILDTIANQTSNTYIIRYRSSNDQNNGIQRNGICSATINSSSDAINFNYVPGGAPKITRTLETLQLYIAPIFAGTTPKISVHVKDNAAPFVQRVSLHARKTGAAYEFKEISMTLREEDIYEANLPGEEVASPGVEYYIRATDGQVTTSSPANDPIENAYSLAVLPNHPPTIEHKPLSQCYANKPLEINVKAADSTFGVSKITLYYRSKGKLLWSQITKSYTTIPLLVVNETFIIPGSDILLPSIEYYIEAHDSFNVSSTYPVDGLDNPHQCMVLAYNPVILIAGVMGTELDDTNNNNIWPLAVAAPFGEGVKDLQFTEYGLPRTDTLSNKLYPKKFLGIGYQIDKLQKSLENSGYTVIPFYYDWRYSIKELSTQLNNFIESNSLLNKSQINIVAHSMGGLVALQYANNLADKANNKINKIICLGTPQLGAPKIFKLLRYADENLAWYFITDYEAKRIAHNLPSAFNLLPGEAYINKYPQFFEFYEYNEKMAAASELHLISNTSQTYPSINNYTNSLGKFYNYAQFIDFLSNAEEKIQKLPDKDPQPTEKLSSYLVENFYHGWQHVRDNLLTNANVKNVYLIVGYNEETLAGIKEYDKAIPNFSNISQPYFERQVSIITETGDGTVPLISSKGINGNVYYADMKKMSANHTEMLGKNPIFHQVLSLLTNGDGVYPSGEMYFTRDEPVNKSNKVSFTTRSLASTQVNNGEELQSELSLANSRISSLVHMYVENKEGLRSGFLADGSMIKEIPGAAVERFGNEEFVVVQSDGEFRLNIAGHNTGAFTLEISDINTNNETKKTNTWNNINTSKGAVCQINTVFDEQKRFLNVDTNLDGVPDKFLPPSEVYDGDGGRHNIEIKAYTVFNHGLVNQKYTSIIDVKNLSLEKCQGAKIYLQIPLGAKLVSVDKPHEVIDQAIQLKLGDLEPGNSVSTTLDFVSTLPGSYTYNYICVGNGIDMDLSNNSTSQKFFIVENPSGLVGLLLERIKATNLDGRNKQPYYAILNSSISAFERSNWIAALNNLRAFQKMVNSQVVTVNIEAAQQWVAEAQSIIDLILGSDLHLYPKKGGIGVDLKFRGIRGKRYIVEYSTDLVTWKKLGDAMERGIGEFVYEDKEKNSARFYRLVTK